MKSNLMNGVTIGIILLISTFNICVAQVWEKSFEAGTTDANGHYMGGSQLMHLTSYKGSLYASVSYWMDSRCPYYGGTDPNTGWGQVIRLDSANGDWVVDLEMGRYWLRPEILHPITFTTDSLGNALPDSVSLLITGSYAPLNGNDEVHLFVRNDETGDWTDVFVHPHVEGAHHSTRDIQVYKDRVTGIDRVYLTIGTVGIFSGVYDPSLPGKIKWDTEPEQGPLDTRPLSIVEANDKLYFTAGSYVYERINGPNASWKIVYDMSDELNGEQVNPAIGGYRGLTAIPNPNGSGESLIFAWSAIPLDLGHIYRLDPDGNGGFNRIKEATIAELMSEYLGGNPCYFSLPAYNRFYPVNINGETEYIVGFESWIGGFDYPTIWGNANGGFYKGAVYALRNEDGSSYRIEEVNGPIGENDKPLVATVCYEKSPFKDENAIYFGGLDPNSYEATNMAWIYKSVYPLTNIEEVSENNEPLNILPNPAQSNLTIEIPADMNLGQLMIYNELGQLQIIYSNLSGTLLKIETVNLPNGIYFAVLQKDDKIITNKIVINK